MSAPSSSSSSSSSRPRHPLPQLPSWQPDSSAKACPICSTTFTFFNRRHHCRRCGRVVCATCSPHRISIPRAFIVRPPVELVDLTLIAATAGVTAREGEAGEGVRICEECLAGARTPYLHHHHQHNTHAVEVPRGRRCRPSMQGARSVPLPGPPQFREEDYCPICHRALPYLSDASDAGREAHISSCIVAATSPSPRPPQPSFSSAATGSAVGGKRGRSYTNGGRMVVWNAGEKDCRDPSTGGPVECVICFEEFLVGVEIARLECLCRYHKKCIRAWFDRKGNGECPTHAIHE